MCLTPFLDFPDYCCVQYWGPRVAFCGYCMALY
jgi:hypothetical protein